MEVDILVLSFTNSQNPRHVRGTGRCSFWSCGIPGRRRKTWVEPAAESQLDSGCMTAAVIPNTAAAAAATINIVAFISILFGTQSPLCSPCHHRLHLCRHRLGMAVLVIILLTLILVPSRCHDLRPLLVPTTTISVVAAFSATIGLMTAVPTAVPTTVRISVITGTVATSAVTLIILAGATTAFTFPVRSLASFSSLPWPPGIVLITTAVTFGGRGRDVTASPLGIPWGSTRHYIPGRSQRICTFISLASPSAPPPPWASPSSGRGHGAFHPLFYFIVRAAP